MKTKKVEWMRKEQPIAVLKNGEIITNRGPFFYLHKNGKRLPFSHLDMGIADSIKSTVPFLRRIFRQEVRCYCINEDKVYFFKNRKFYQLILYNKKIEQIDKLGKSVSMPLHITPGRDKYQVIWGDYGGNPEHHQVNIYGLADNGEIRIIYSFPRNTIRHVHNIVQDNENGYFIFTGDNEECAGIYYANLEFTQVIPICIGSQDARAVVGFPVKEGLLYATDSVEQKNHIYLLNKDENWKPYLISSLSGSCIYGTAAGDGWYFSTTVESGESTGKIRDYLSIKRGKGILTDHVELIYVDKKYTVNKIISLKKDLFPYKLFQYGSIRFAVTEDKSENIYIYPMATKKYSERMGRIK